MQRGVCVRRARVSKRGFELGENVRRLGGGVDSADLCLHIGGSDSDTVTLRENRLLLEVNPDQLFDFRRRK
jgi:hypothetical protein